MKIKVIMFDAVIFDQTSANAIIEELAESYKDTKFIQFFTPNLKEPIIVIDI